jgi:hypothetical protein
MWYTGPTRAFKAGQKKLVLHEESNEPTKEGTLSYLYPESTFASVTTASRGHPLLVSL